MPGKIIIIGAKGRFGRHAVSKFRDAGWRVRAFARSWDKVSDARVYRCRRLVLHTSYHGASYADAHRYDNLCLSDRVDLERVDLVCPHSHGVACQAGCD